MPVQPLPITRTLSGAARVLGSAAAAGSALLVAYSSSPIARGLPDRYHGQTRGSLLLSLAILTGSVGGLVAKPYLRVALAILSMVCLAMAVYFLAY